MVLDPCFADLPAAELFGWYPGEEAERWGVFARPGDAASFKAAAIAWDGTFGEYSTSATSEELAFERPPCASKKPALEVESTKK